MRRSVPVLGTGAGPDVFTFNSIMHGMASAGECERLLVLLGEMRGEYGISPDVVSYNTAMAACNEVSSRRVLRSVSSWNEVGFQPVRRCVYACSQVGFVRV